jgi:hypothetical protein
MGQKSKKLQDDSLVFYLQFKKSIKYENKLNTFSDLLKGKKTKNTKHHTFNRFIHDF